MKFHYLYIGDCADGLNKRSERFIVESEKMWKIDEDCKGSVVLANKNAPHSVGHKSENWSNPVKDMANGHYPAFVRIYQYNFDAMKDAGKI